jgi:hypothetical protein
MYTTFEIAQNQHQYTVSSMSSLQGLRLNISINNKRIRLSDLIFTWGYMSRVTFLVF